MEKTIKKVILTRGIQGSGKTTWAKAYVAEDPVYRIRLNYDDIRNMLGPYWIPARESVVKRLLWEGVELAAGFADIVIDNMNLNPDTILGFKNWIATYNKSAESKRLNVEYVLEFKDFFIPVEECIRRDAMRPNPIGEQVIRQTWNKYKHFIQTTKVENLVKNLIHQDPNKEKCIVVDMDSTLCFNTSKRPWYGKDSTELMLTDTPNRGVVDIVKNLPYPIIICTGRNRAQEKVTREWLQEYEITPAVLYMRNDGDYRKGVDVKSELISEILQQYNIVAVFEDCEPIVEKFREMGLTVLQPNKGL